MIMWSAAAWAASQAMTTAQHANTIQLEILILSAVTLVLGVTFKIGRDTGIIKTRLDDLSGRVDRIETLGDADVRRKNGHPD